MEPKRMNLFRCDVFRHFHKDAGQTRSIKGDLNLRRIAKAFTILAAICAICSSTQISQAQQQNLASSNLPNFGLNGPGWAEVLSVTPKWVVLQAADGRQYPVSASALGRFIVRWPILPTMVSATAVVEAEGQSPSVNTVLTNYVEVYEGAARSFVSQTYITPTDAGILRQYDATYTFGFDSMNQFWSMYPSQPAVAMQNVQLLTYIVAPVVNIFPLMLGTPSNQAVRIAPANGQAYRMTRIVVGSIDQLRPGDLVYAVPADANTKGMALSVMIVYKKDYPVVTHN